MYKCYIPDLFQTQPLRCVHLTCQGLRRTGGELGGGLRQETGKDCWSLHEFTTCLAVVSWTMLDSHLEPSKIGRLCKEKVWAPEKKTWCCA